MPRAVVFDLFGTLVDDSPPTAYAEFLAGMAERLGANAERFRALWDANAPQRYTGPLETTLHAICSELGVSDRDRMEQALAFRHDHVRRLLVPRPDAEETLAALRDRGLLLGMISNATGEVSTLWAETPLAPLFDVALFSADEGLMKPDRRLYERVCERLGVAPEDCLFVGDGAYRELQGAAEVGMTAVLIRAPYDKWEHEGTVGWQGPRVSSLREVLALV